MRRTGILLLCITFVLTGCKAKELADKAAIAADLDSRGTVDLMKEVAEDEYTPPADGRLTDAQIQMYLKVREHEKTIAKVAKEQMEQHSKTAENEGEKSIAGMIDGFKALGSAADFLTADIRAAKDLGFNSQEYLWVKGQIMAASTAAMAEKFTEAMTTNFDNAYAEAKKAYDEAADNETKKLYAEILAGYDKSRQEMRDEQAQTDPSVSFNRQLLSRYENALNAYAHELSKYEQNEGDAQKAVEEMTKGQ